MDPGNWATDLAGGSRFGYTLLSVILLSNLMAILLQALCARAGHRHRARLAQACRDTTRGPSLRACGSSARSPSAACDLAEVIGSAIALNLLFGLPLIWGVVPHRAGRPGRAVSAEPRVSATSKRSSSRLILAIGGCVLLEICLSRPDVLGRGARVRAARGHPADTRHAVRRHRHSRRDGDAPQPLPPLVHRPDAKVRDNDEGKAEAIKFATIDSTVALMFALFINARDSGDCRGHVPRSGHENVAEIQDAYKLLSPLLGVPVASALFASRCWRPDRTPRSPERWPARS